MVSYRKEIPSSLDLLPLGERYGDKNKARQRARPNAKFAHIKSSIDQGRKQKQFVVMDSKEQNRLVRRKGENFGRIAPQTLANYIMEGRAAVHLNQNLDDIQILRKGHYPTKRPPIETTLPKIILLDLRSFQDYAEGHVTNAISFPAENIQKDQVFAQLSIYKNKPDKILVVYHEDERHSILQSQVIYEKGFDNVYLLSGAYWNIEQEYPNLIVRPSTSQAVPAQQVTSSPKSTTTAAGAMAVASAPPTSLAQGGAQAGAAPARGMSARNSQMRSKQSLQLKTVQIR